MPRPLQDHQAEALRRSIDREAFAFFMEERTRKTRIVLETARAHYPGRINAVLVIGWPNGVQFGWGEEWALDWPEGAGPYRFLAWRSGGMREEAISAFFRFDGLIVLAMNSEAIITAMGKRAVAHVLRTRRCLVAADESSFMKSPGAAVTKMMLQIGRHPNAVLRRLLDGTPAAEGSLDLWAPCAFLDWRLLGHRSFYTFKHYYAVMGVGYGRGGRQFEAHLVDERGNKRYQNLDELRERLAGFSYRVLRSDVSGAPPPGFRSIHFELTAKQRRVYDRLDGEFIAELRRGELPVALAITRLLRLQMISRNYHPPETIAEPCPCGGVEACEACDGTGYVVLTTELERIDDRNPAIEALIADAALIDGPVVVWVRFRQDATDAAAALAGAGRSVGRYDGSIDVRDREAAYAAFRAGRLDAIVGTASSGLSRGKDLSIANHVIFYSNSYRLRDRLQATSRTESLDRTVPTSVADLIGVDTRDGPIVAALRGKVGIAEMIQGDRASAFARSGEE